MATADLACCLKSEHIIRSHERQKPQAGRPRRMKTTGSFAAVLVTAPDLKTARVLAKAALKVRLVSCVNLVPKIESHYWWQGKIESGTEVLLIFKTKKARLAALERLIFDKHPYDTPEFLVLTLSAGSRKYLNWLAANCR
jgi:periplasmic divalent cation tolerance protein